jgi:hypothetical protein
VPVALRNFSKLTDISLHDKESKIPDNQIFARIILGLGNELFEPGRALQHKSHLSIIINILK